MGVNKIGSLRDYRNHDWLHNKYEIENLTIKQIADMCNCNPHTIWENMVRLKIVSRNPGPVEHSIETKLRISKSLIGKKPMLGKSHSKETKDGMSKARTGNGNANWKGGVTFNSRKFRKSRQYRLWRNYVLKRDNNSCQYEQCGINTNIAHHIKPAKEYPELRVDPNNGMAVCENHHKLIHKKLRQCKELK